MTCLCSLLVLVLLPVDVRATDKGLDAAFLADDECTAGDPDAACALSAIQLRGQASGWQAAPAGLAATQAEQAQKADQTGGGYVTNAAVTRTFAWTPNTRSVQASVAAAFPGGWRDLRFREGHVPVTLRSLVAWVEDELFNGPDPFAAHGGQVPVPATAGGEDQLAPGEWVGYSRRQLCFVVAKSLVGSSTAGYNNGLLRFMERRTGWGGSARTGDFGRTWWVLVAACAADPGLADGRHGPLLLAAKGYATPDTEAVRRTGAEVPLTSAGLRVCRYDDGGAGGLPGLTPVPGSGCASPGGGPGRDFMTGGLRGQAVQDISAAWLGGYIFGNADGIGGGQDERLMVYFPEVAALAFFLSQGGGAPQLRQPAWILGARMLGVGLDGTGRFDLPVVVDPGVPMTSDLVPISLGGRQFMISSSRPFIAFQSENQAFIPYGGAGLATATKLARRNKEPLQRLFDGPFSFANQVRAWYRSLALTSYDPAVRPVLQALVKSIGTGPWLAGLWFGDSQLGVLASWLGHALAAQTWGGSLPLDYYIYSAFTENPGNQCYVHSATNCQACLAQCHAKPLPPSAFWLPSEAMMGPDPCVYSQPTDCGQKGLEHVVEAYASKSVGALWADVEASLRSSNRATQKSVFDLLLTA